MSLLDEVKQTTSIRKRKITDDEIELAIAWLKDEINISQIQKALKYGSVGSAIYFVAQILKEAYKVGAIEERFGEYEYYNNIK